MTRVYLLVEGQTEEAFVNELLLPHYAAVGLYLMPIIVSTSPSYKGGVVSFGKIKPQIERLCKQDAAAYVSTMFDLYALPNDFPGKTTEEYPVTGTGAQKATFLEQQLKANIAQRNFIPNLIVHEFEALLFVQPEQFGVWVDDATVVATLARIRQGLLPEDINEKPQTAPSKRILATMPNYQKTVHGPLIACDIGLDAIRSACPHFHAWLQKLEALSEK